MRVALIAGALIFGAAASANAMPVATFLAKAESLKKKGPLALMSGDLKLLLDQVKSDSASLRAENERLAASGRSKLYCTPDGFRMGQDDILGAMRAVPATERARISTRDALRDYLARRHPCRA